MTLIRKIIYKKKQLEVKKEEEEEEKEELEEEEGNDLSSALLRCLKNSSRTSFIQYSTTI